MADQKLYLLSVRWDQFQDDVWTVLLSPAEERLLWRSLNVAVREDVIQDFFLGPAKEYSLAGLMQNLKGTDLGPYVNPKSWSPGPKRET